MKISYISSYKLVFETRTRDKNTNDWEYQINFIQMKLVSFKSDVEYFEIKK